MVGELVRGQPTGQQPDHVQLAGGHVSGPAATQLRAREPEVCAASRTCPQARARVRSCAMASSSGVGAVNRRRGI